MVKAVLIGSAALLAITVLNSCEGQEPSEEKKEVVVPEPQEDSLTDTTSQEHLDPTQMEAMMLAQDIDVRQGEVSVAFTQLSYSTEDDIDANLYELERVLQRHIVYLGRVKTQVPMGKEAVLGLKGQLEFLKSQLRTTMEPAFRQALKDNGGVPPEGGLQSVLSEEFVRQLEEVSDKQAEPFIQMVKVNGLMGPQEAPADSISQ